MWSTGRLWGFFGTQAVKAADNSAADASPITTRLTIIAPLVAPLGVKK